MIYFHDIERGPYGAGVKNHWRCAGVVTYTDFSETGITDCEWIIGIEVH